MHVVVAVAAAAVVLFYVGVLVSVVNLTRGSKVMRAGHRLGGVVRGCLSRTVWGAGP